MADNMTTELEGQGPEGQLDTKSEIEPNSVVTFVYRGENPFLISLVQHLKNSGIPVDAREISNEDYKSNTPEGLRTLIGPISGVIVTDETLRKVVSGTPGCYAVSAEYAQQEADTEAYANRGENSVDKVASAAKPVIDQILKAGKIPVVYEDHLGDHFSDKWKYSLDPPRDPSNDEAKDVMGNRPLKIKYQSDEYFNYSGFYAGILEKYCGAREFSDDLPLNDIVWLYDHHATYDKTRETREIVLVCPCCLNTISGMDYQKRAAEKGYRLFPLDEPAEITGVAEKLMQLIEAVKKERSIQAPKAETNQVQSEPESNLKTEPQPETERISLLRRALNAFGGKK